MRQREKLHTNICSSPKLLPLDLHFLLNTKGVPQVSGFRQEVVLVLETLPAKSSLSDEGAIKGRERDARFKFFFPHKKKGEDWTPLGDKSKRLNRCKRLKELIEASNDETEHKVKRYETSNQDQIKVLRCLAWFRSIH